ncbi:MAG TPA: hypothetical protein VJ276_04235 [Thermoanaerobaculia bacterium]|nr:hypothetical protein [Thermoanaerobaculia bacterium]
MHLLLALLFALPTREAALIDCSARIVATDGEKMWPGWAAAPRSVLLVGAETEWLIAPPAGVPPFEERKRTFDPKLLATFPVFSAEPTVVVGMPAATGKTEEQWLWTLVHERFHQFQYSRPGYYERAEKLGLSRGDTTGMWMLNYPFPYDEAAEPYAAFSRAVGAALRARQTPNFAPKLREAKRAWRAFRDALKPDDYAYFRFQVWQEGVARYTEITLTTSEPCATSRPPNMIIDALDKPALREQKRVAFYALGAGIAMLLDETSPDWKRGYIDRPFEIDTYFQP